jgi:hypothetical protein
VLNFNCQAELNFPGARYDILLNQGLEKCETNPKSAACAAFILASLLDYQKFSLAQVRCHFLCQTNTSDDGAYMEWYNLNQRFSANFENSEDIRTCIQKHYGRKYPNMNILNIFLYLNIPLMSIHRYFYEVIYIKSLKKRFKFFISILRSVE